MGKIIIDNQSELTDTEAIDLVISVINLGRISNNGKQYCYGTTFEVRGKNYIVLSRLNKKSDGFVVMDHNS